MTLESAPNWSPQGKQELEENPFKGKKIVILDDDANFTDSISDIVGSLDYKPTVVNNLEKFSQMLENGEISRQADLILLDLFWKGQALGLKILDDLRRKHPEIPAIVLSGYNESTFKIECLSRGAFAYLLKVPKTGSIKGQLKDKLYTALEAFRIPPSQLINILQERLVESERLLKEGQSLVREDLEITKRRLIGIDSPAMEEVVERIGRLARSKDPVLLTGERGTGKDLIAQTLHYHHHSPRKSKVFVVVPPGIPKSLYVGHLGGITGKGAFTGAEKLLGFLERANGGTVYFPDLTVLDTDLQGVLLSALDDNPKFFRVGSTDLKDLDARVIASTNVNIREAQANGLLLQDLVDRISAAEVKIPSLHERQSDIPEIVAYILNDLSQENDGRVARISDDAFNLILEYNQSDYRPHRWNGNVRELRYAIRVAFRYAQGRVISPANIIRARSRVLESVSPPSSVNQEPGSLL